MKINYLRVLGNIFFLVGIIFSFALAVLLTWNKIEAINYYFTGVTYPSFNGLRCPVVMTQSEQVTVTAIFDNPAAEADNFYYRVEISNIAEPRRIEDQIAVAAHDRKSLQWIVSKEDIDLRYFVFVKMSILRNALHSTQEATCGITVLNFQGLTGQQFFVIALVLGVFGIGLGLGIWKLANSTKDYRQPVLGVVVLLAMLSGLMGWWLMGVILIAITILLLTIFARNALM